MEDTIVTKKKDSWFIPCKHCGQTKMEHTEWMACNWVIGPDDPNYTRYEAIEEQ